MLRAEIIDVGEEFGGQMGGPGPNYWKYTQIATFGTRPCTYTIRGDTSPDSNQLKTGTN